jgi:hypothetical protein
VPTDTAFRLSGEQTVRTIAESHRALSAYYDQSATIPIDTSDVTDADLTLVQLIESVRVAAASDGKKVCMSTRPSTTLRDVLVRGGFLNSPANALFWTAP